MRRILGIQIEGDGIFLGLSFNDWVDMGSGLYTLDELGRIVHIDLEGKDEVDVKRSEDELKNFYANTEFIDADGEIVELEIQPDDSSDPEDDRSEREV